MSPYNDLNLPWLDAFLLWLSATELRAFFYRFEDFDWLFVFAHVSAAAVLLGSILIVDLRIIGVVREINLRKLARLALPWSIGGAIIALLSGVILLLFDPIAVGVHTYFLPKMALILLGLGNALAFHSVINLDVAETPSVRTRFAGVVSIVLWAGVFLCAALNSTERISSTSHAEMQR